MEYNARFRGTEVVLTGLTSNCVPGLQRVRPASCWGLDVWGSVVVVPSKNLVLVFSVLALTSFMGCKSMRPQEGKPGVSKTDIKPGKPPSIKTNQERRLSESDLSQEERLREQALLEGDVLAADNVGVENIALANPSGFSSLPQTGAGDLQTFDSATGLETGANGSLAVPLAPGTALGAAVNVDQIVQSPGQSGTSCANGACDPRRSSSALSAGTHGAAGGLN